MSGRQERINVIQHPWRVVYSIDSPLGPETIKYTLEAECWNKAYLKASDEAFEIASMLGVDPSMVRIDSVKRIVPASE